MQKRKSPQRELIKSLSRIPGMLCLVLVRIYQAAISPLKRPTCRFYPSCSRYFYEAIQRYGLIKGGTMGLKRILRCHPFHPGGYDPVR